MTGSSCEIVLAFQKCFLPNIQHGRTPLDPEEWLGRAVGSGCSRSPLGNDGLESHSTAGRIVTDCLRDAFNLPKAEAVPRRALCKCCSSAENTRWLLGKK